MKKNVLILLTNIIIATNLFGQDIDSLKIEIGENQTSYTIATFKTTRVINGHSVETIGKGILDIKISHRFSTLNRGLYELFGLDNASMRMGGDYGITDRLMIGVGRSTFQKQYDGFVKYKLMRQSSGYRANPVTVSLMGGIMVKTLKSPDPAIKIKLNDNLYYTAQLLIARKFSDNFSLQLMPTMVHHNLVKGVNDPNDIFAIGIGARQKITKRTSINGEYYIVTGDKLPNTYNSLSFGFDIETGGHVFQLHFTNSTGMTERTFISETDGRWGKGDIHFGFNIARVFVIGGKKKREKAEEANQ
jgi:hypothetical protein